MSQVVKGARKSLLVLAASVAVVYGLLGLGVMNEKTEWTPGLALDLAGGTEIILEPIAADGQVVTASDLQQAVEVIRRRIDGTGVSEAEITTEGGKNIKVSLPGTPSDSTLDLISRSSQMQFRPVILTGNALEFTVTGEPTPSPSVSATASPSPAPTAGPSVEPSPAGTATPSVSASAEPSATPTALPTDPSSDEWLTPALLAEFDALNCFDTATQVAVAQKPSSEAVVMCDAKDPVKYILGPVEVAGTDIKTASSGPEFNSTGGLTGRQEVRLELTESGAKKFDTVTQRLLVLQNDKNRFAIVLDDVVISAPGIQSRISNGSASITGSFTQVEAEELANQLKFGALPMTLKQQSSQTIAATLGAEQLQKGLLAGLIGLVLVVIYSLIQYRGLGLVTVASLVIAAVLTFGVVALMSWAIGYRLSLAGVAGLIVAIGITADSFIVYFERIRDELRDGRSLAASVDHGWKRAKRTILASDAVSFLAAFVLYTLTVGSVRGFAFTLGLTTIIDLFVVMVFTHPTMILLARTKFFGEGHKWSGLDPRQLGRDAIYKGRGRIAEGPTLAERKAGIGKAGA